MDAAGPQPIGVYINKRRHRTIEDKMSCRTVYTLCTEEERIPGMSWVVRCWYQDAVNEPEK